MKKAQQGELDAVAMYKALAEVAKDPITAELFRKTAAEEGHHANVCKQYTNDASLKPNPLKAKLLSRIYKVCPPAALLMLARGEYKAAKDYAPCLLEYPAIEEVLKDEIRHGDRMKHLMNVWFQEIRPF